MLFIKILLLIAPILSWAQVSPPPVAGLNTDGAVSQVRVPGLDSKNSIPSATWPDEVLSASEEWVGDWTEASGAIIVTVNSPESSAVDGLKIEHSHNCSAAFKTDSFSHSASATVPETKDVLGTCYRVRYTNAGNAVSSGSWSIQTKVLPGITTLARAGNASGEYDTDLGETTSQTLRASANIARDGNELSYNDGSSDANTLRASSNIKFDGVTPDKNFGAAGSNTLRTAAIPGNASGIADFNSGATGAQTPRVASNLHNASGAAFTSTTDAGKTYLDVSTGWYILSQTTTPLGSGLAYTGAWVDISGCSGLAAFTYADVASATDGLHIRFSDDASTVRDDSDPFTIPADNGQYQTITPSLKYAQVSYTNGSSAQATFLNQLHCHKAYMKPSSHRLGEKVTSQSDGELVKAAQAGEYNETLENGVSGEFLNGRMSRRGSSLTTLFDPESGRTAYVDQYDSLKTAEAVRLLGGNFIGSTLNANIWTSTLVGSGTSAVSGGQINLATGVTANSSAALTSVDIAPYISGNVHNYVADVRIGTLGVSNNSKKWGPHSTTDGAYFKYENSAFSVCTLKASTENCVASGSFTNGQTVTLDTNFHKYEVAYTSSEVHFYQDRKLLHKIIITDSPLFATYHFPARASNVNSGGGTTNSSLFITAVAIHRYGASENRPRSSFFNTVTTNTLKSEPGTLHILCVNRTGGIGTTTVTLYDNTAASGTIISQITLGGNGAICQELSVDFNVGLTVVNGSANFETEVVWE